MWSITGLQLGRVIRASRIMGPSGSDLREAVKVVRHSAFQIAERKLTLGSAPDITFRPGSPGVCAMQLRGKVEPKALFGARHAASRDPHPAVDRMPQIERVVDG